MKAFPGYVEDFQKFALDFVEKYAIDTQQVTNYITDTDFFEKLTGFVTDAPTQKGKIDRRWQRPPMPLEAHC